MGNDIVICCVGEGKMEKKMRNEMKVREKRKS